MSLSCGSRELPCRGLSRRGLDRQRLRRGLTGIPNCAAIEPGTCAKRSGMDLRVRERAGCGAALLGCHTDTSPQSIRLRCGNCRRVCRTIHWNFVWQMGSPGEEEEASAPPRFCTWCRASHRSRRRPNCCGADVKTEFMASRSPRMMSPAGDRRTMMAPPSASLLYRLGLAAAFSWRGHQLSSDRSLAFTRPLRSLAVSDDPQPRASCAWLQSGEELTEHWPLAAAKVIPPSIGFAAREL